MGIPKCEHGVYSPNGPGEPSQYCTGCTSPSAPLTPPAPSKNDCVVKDGRELWMVGGCGTEDGWITRADGHHVWIIGLFEPVIEADEPEEAVVDCPRCFAQILVTDEYDIECPRCGYNGLQGAF